MLSYTGAIEKFEHTRRFGIGFGRKIPVGSTGAKIKFNICKMSESLVSGGTLQMNLWNFTSGHFE